MLVQNALTIDSNFIKITSKNGSNLPNFYNNIMRQYLKKEICPLNAIKIKSLEIAVFQVQLTWSSTVN